MQDKLEWYLYCAIFSALGSILAQVNVPLSAQVPGEGNPGADASAHPDLADLGMRCVRHTPDGQNRYSGNSQGASERALVPKCKM